MIQLSKLISVEMVPLLWQGISTAEKLLWIRPRLKITWILNVILTLVIILFREPVAAIYNFSPETADMLMKALFVYAIALTPKMLCFMMICYFEWGGDTMFCLYVDVSFDVDADSARIHKCFGT